MRNHAPRTGPVAGLGTGYRFVLPTALVSGIGQALPQLIPAIVKAIVLIVSSLLGNIDQIIEAGMSLLLSSDAEALTDSSQPFMRGGR